ncbi:MAG: sulfatase-like hydrolase/transferase, partial [Verrucomicrobiia bacterium]
MSESPPMPVIRKGSSITLRCIGLILSLTLSYSHAAQSNDTPVNRDANKPNIVIILADDLGYADVSYNGGTAATPNIDRLANEGVKLQRFYACPLCSPTRAGLMTGRWPIRY